MRLSDESFAIFLLCSHLGLPDDMDLKPLSPREWNKLELKLAANSFNLAALAGSSSEQIKTDLEIDADEAVRLSRLLDRASVLEQEIERLADLGIWILTRLDENYPTRFTERLKTAAPVLLYGSGSARLLGRRGLAVIGSRNVDERGFALTEFIGTASAESKLTVYSGGARGVDKTAMGAALAAGGSAAGLLADSLERGVRASDARTAIEEGKLVLATPYSPHASFNVGMAMARNKLIYALADFALVIASDAEKGGTWAGAEEALKANWTPVFAVDGPEVPDGNRLLIKRGAIPFPKLSMMLRRRLLIGLKSTPGPKSRQACRAVCSRVVSGKYVRRAALMLPSGTQPKDYRAILGVASDADRDEIRRAYRTKARKLHPDLGGSSDEMKLLNEAYEVLIDLAPRDQEEKLAVRSSHSGAAPTVVEYSVSRPQYELPKEWLGLVTRAVCSILLGFVCFAGSADLPGRAHAVYAWLTIGLAFLFLLLGCVMLYAAHLLNTDAVSPRSALVRTSRVGFLIAVFALIILVSVSAWLQR